MCEREHRPRPNDTTKPKISVRARDEAGRCADSVLPLCFNVVMREPVTLTNTLWHSGLTGKNNKQEGLLFGISASGIGAENAAKRKLTLSCKREAAVVSGMREGK